ncbi:hypothetical protein B296_00030340 [Ensete ventricosum]|uniref:Uncharacterized protein n=1 Tax=Ensete ventricosum TaxID=4639 RepID=A0A426Z1F6_ENSVE|nr:hypothetical protein B296_00030340 [Ensete ventricosum]
MLSYPSTTPVVLAVRHASVGKGCRPYLCQVDRTTTGAPHTCIRPASHVGAATSTGQLSEDARTWRSGQHLPYHSHPPPEDLLEVPGEGAEDEVLCLAAGPWWLWTSPEWELRNLNGAGADPTEQELGNSNGARADPTEQELGNWNGAGVDPTEQELGISNGARADPTEQELENWNGAGADPTE